MKYLVSVMAVMAVALVAPLGAFFTDASDNFNRADNTTLGANWTDLESEWGISSNQAYQANSTVNAVAIALWASSSNTFSANQFSQVTCNFSGTTFSTSCGVTLRFTGASFATQTGYICSTDGTTSTIYRQDAGPTYNSVNSAPQAIASGDVIRCDISGSAITFARNGTTVVTGTDSTYGSGQPGIETYGPTLNVFFFDDWSAGPISAGAAFPAAILNAPVRGGGRGDQR